MSTDAPLSSRRRPWLRIVFALLVICGVGAAAFWLLRPEQVSATALFEVRNESPSIVNGSSALSVNGFDILKKTQIAYLKSKYVLTSAVTNPGIAALSIFAGVGNPDDWLQEHLEVSFPQDGEILAITLRGRKDQANDLTQVVDAVAAAYKKEVLGNEKSRRLTEHDMLERSMTNLQAEIKRKYEDYIDIAKGMGRPEASGSSVDVQIALKRLDRVDDELAGLEREELKIDTDKDAMEAKFVKQRMEQLHNRQAKLQKEIERLSEKSVELITRKNELEQLQNIANELSIKLEKLDIDSEAPYPIRQVQPAMIEPAAVAFQ